MRTRVAYHEELDDSLGGIRTLRDRVAGLKPGGYIGRGWSGN
jgi:hypothetical protein